MSDVQIQTTEQPTVAFVLSLLAGLWMLAAGSMMGGWHGMGGWMWGRGMRSFGVLWPWFGIFAGIVVLIGATPTKQVAKSAALLTNRQGTPPAL